MEIEFLSCLIEEEQEMKKRGSKVYEEWLDEARKLFKRTVCHFPPGTSKWNKIEHCMFSFISMNCRGKPLASYETIIKLIGSTKTKKGLRVEAQLDEKDYETGKKILDQDMARLKINLHKLYPKWNYIFD